MPARSPAFGGCTECADAALGLCGEVIAVCCLRRDYNRLFHLRPQNLRHCAEPGLDLPVLFSYVECVMIAFHFRM